MKIKIKFQAEREILENYKVVRTELVNDAIQAKDLDGHKLAVGEFGKSMSNNLYMGQVPEKITDIIEFRRFLEKMHDNDGQEIEIDEIYIPILKDVVRRTQNVLVYASLCEMLDKALLAAQNNKKLTSKK